MNIYNSLYRGIIEDNIDPENLGRCRIRVPSIHGELNYPITALPWARPIVLSSVGVDRGSVNIPNIGDIVWVLFEGSIKDFPVYLGGTYARGEIAINPDIIDFHIDKDSKISYDKSKNQYSINVKDISIKVSEGGIIIDGDLRVNGDLIYKELIHDDN